MWHDDDGTAMSTNHLLARRADGAATWLAVAGGVLLLGGGLALLLSGMLVLVGCDGDRTCLVDADCVSTDFVSSANCSLSWLMI